jgi:hypothetical protein
MTPFHVISQRLDNGAVHVLLSDVKRSIVGKIADDSRHVYAVFNHTWVPAKQIQSH